MKSAILLTIITLMLFACNNKNTESVAPKTIHRDTIATLLLYPSFFEKTLLHDVGTRIIKDTLKFSMTDTSTYKKRWTRDTMYIVPVPTPLYDTATKKRLLNADGKPKDSVMWYFAYPSAIVIDANKNIDSITKIFYGKDTLPPAKNLPKDTTISPPKK